MRKKKKIELVEAFASLCRDVGYKNATVNDIDGDKLFDKIIDLLNHSLDLNAIDDIHERFFTILSSNKKLEKLLDDPEFQEVFNDEAKRIGTIKRYKEKDCYGCYHINNYFALDPKRFFINGVSIENKFGELNYNKHQITIPDDDSGLYLWDKNATIYDKDDNRIVQVSYVGGDRVFKLKHNNLPFAISFDPENGVAYIYNLDYYNSCNDESELDIDKAIAMIATDIPNEDTTLGYSYVIVTNDAVYYIYLIFLLAIAFILGFMLHISSYRSGTLALNTMFLARLAMRH